MRTTATIALAMVLIAGQCIELLVRAPRAAPFEAWTPGSWTQIKQAAVPAPILAQFRTEFHSSGNLIRERSHPGCSPPQTFKGVLGWYRFPEMLTAEQRAHGIRASDVYAFKVKYYRDETKREWDDIDNSYLAVDESPYEVAYVKRGERYEVHSRMLCP